MKLYLIRHGQSEANLKDMMSTPQVPLTQQGIEDARRVGEMLRKLSFDRVFVSPYLRAIQTQQYAMPGVTGEIVECIHENNNGSLEGRFCSDIIAEYGDAFAEMIRVDDFTSVGGENYASARGRARKFMRFLESIDCDNAVAFTHLGFVLAFFDEVMGRLEKPGRHIDCANGSVSIFEYRKGIWYVSAFNITPDVLG